MVYSRDMNAFSFVLSDASRFGHITLELQSCVFFEMIHQRASAGNSRKTVARQQSQDSREAAVVSKRVYIPVCMSESIGRTRDLYP
jgi:hypothetical protein